MSGFFSEMTKGVSQIQMILVLRCAAILVQFFLILFVNLGLDHQLPWLPLMAVILVEIAFTLASGGYYWRRSAQQRDLVIQISADILFLSLLLYFSGGATNAFVSLLLLPIALAAVTLTPWLLSLVAVSAIACYSVLLWLTPMHMMHGNMEGHFIAMWVNFLFSTGVVAIVVGKMARSINQRERAIAAYREEQLKQEKVISLGVASAQITHQLATPIATIQLLADELKEDFPSNEAVEDMQTEIARCSKSLGEFREMVFDIKEQTSQLESCADILDKISDNLGLNYPDVHIKINHLAAMQSFADHKVVSDATLLPAILNLINNGIRATKANNNNNIELNSDIVKQRWQLEIRDFGKGFKRAELAELGVKPVESNQGLGMAVFLSHSSLERLGGKLSLTNHESGGAKVTLSMPLVKEK
ncbi:ATP-binding protein [Thalassotalea sp. PLHSN55]|uniref:ATP-binding protein n=1 Tax=Thalassotalea sp. PLHSN55 TaxID=3435888 RepID=UPI003F872762